MLIYSATLFHTFNYYLIRQVIAIANLVEKTNNWVVTDITILPVLIPYPSYYQ